MELREKTLSKDYKFRGKIINLRVDEAQVPNGNKCIREVIEHNGGVCVVPITDNNEIIYVKQFRYPYSEVIIEIPAGKREGDEEPIVCGKRELKEETGYTAKEFVFLGELYPTPAYCDEIIYMYAAKGLTLGKTNFDNDEFLEIESMPIEQFVEKILSGEIKDAKTQTAVLKVNELMRQGAL